jgi:chromosome segregation ATPase
VKESKSKAERSVEALRDQLKETDDNAQQQIKSLRGALERREVHMEGLQDEKEELLERTQSMRVTIKALEEDRDVLHEEVYGGNRQVGRGTSSNEPESESDDGFQSMIDRIDLLTEERDRARSDSDNFLRALEGKTEEVGGLSAELRKAEESLRESHIRSKDLEDRLIERSVALQAELTESKLGVESSVEA